MPPSPIISVAAAVILLMIGADQAPHTAAMPRTNALTWLCGYRMGQIKVMQQLHVELAFPAGDDPLDPRCVAMADEMHRRGYTDEFHRNPAN